MLKYAIVINEITKQCDIGLDNDICFYESIGMTEQNVEQAYNGDWYLFGYAPIEPIEEKNETIKNTRQSLFTSEADPIRYDMDEAYALGNTEEGDELKVQWLAKKSEIRENNPYIVE